MTRVTDTQQVRLLLTNIQASRRDTVRLSDQISSGLSVQNPGDSSASATIVEEQNLITRIDGHLQRIGEVESFLSFQDEVLSQTGQLILRAKEVATQAANETNGPELREQMSSEIFQLRNQLVTLANSQYRGQYIDGGADNDDPPFDASTTPYANPASGEAAVRYLFDGETGTSVTRSVTIADNVTLRVNTPGNQVFSDAIFALDRLGRAMAGYRTDPATGAPDGTGTAFAFPTDFDEQTADIQNAIDLLDDVRQDDLVPEQADIAGRLTRLDSARNLLQSTHDYTEQALNSLQGVDMVDAASRLSLAQNALEASLAVSARLLNQSILDYL